MKTDTKEVQKTALELFRNKEINEAFDYLFENLDDKNSWKSQLILLSAKNSSLERERISETITKEKYKIEKNRIYLIFSEIVLLLEDEDEPYSNITNSSNYPYSYYPSIKDLQLSVVISLLILILIGIIFIIAKLILR